MKKEKGQTAIPKYKQTNKPKPQQPSSLNKGNKLMVAKREMGWGMSDLNKGN